MNKILRCQILNCVKIATSFSLVILATRRRDVTREVRTGEYTCSSIELAKSLKSKLKHNPAKLYTGIAKFDATKTLHLRHTTEKLMSNLMGDSTYLLNVFLPIL